jgi:hypothetical protein
MMPANYANKFTIEINDVARIVFVDERAPAAPGLPMSVQTATEVVMSHGNFLALAEKMTEVAKKLKP